MCVEVKDEIYAYIARITKLCICVCKGREKIDNKIKILGNEIFHTFYYFYLLIIFETIK